MKNFAVIAAIVACLMLVACGRNEPPKATPAATPLSNAAKAETKKDEAPHAPDTHGMPGMSELFKADDKPAVTANEKPADKAGEKK